MTDPKWLPSEAQIQAAIAIQRLEREMLARRVNDDPQTILAPVGYGKTPGFDKPIPAHQRIINRIVNWITNVTARNR